MAITDINEMLMQPSPIGELFMSGAVLSGPASYPTGGYLVSARLFGLLSKLTSFQPEDISYSGTYYIRALRTGTGTNANTVLVKWYVFATNAEVANTTNLSAEKIRVIVLGN